MRPVGVAGGLGIIDDVADLGLLPDRDHWKHGVPPRLWPTVHGDPLLRPSMVGRPNWVMKAAKVGADVRVLRIGDHGQDLSLPVDRPAVAVVAHGQEAVVLLELERGEARGLAPDGADGAHVADQRRGGLTGGPSRRRRHRGRSPRQPPRAEDHRHHHRQRGGRRGRRRRQPDPPAPPCHARPPRSRIRRRAANANPGRAVSRSQKSPCPRTTQPRASFTSVM